MIFVTVGTHEQPFNRLIEYIDNMKRDGKIQEEVIMQTGFCTYKPQYCNWNNLISYDEIKNNIKEARIIITHGGPASFIMPLQIDKIPIVVPRKFEFNEHVNNHQIEFVKNVSERIGNIIPVYDINDLQEIINKYDVYVKKYKKRNLLSNNEKFCEQFSMLTNEICC